MVWSAEQIPKKRVKRDLIEDDDLVGSEQLPAWPTKWSDPLYSSQWYLVGRLDLFAV